MKILQVCPAYYPALAFGGPILSTLALNKQLSALHEVTTLTTTLGLEPNDARRVVFDCPTISPCGSKLIYQPYSGYPHFTWSPSSLAWLRQHAREFDIVLLQGVWNFPLMAAAWVCQRQGIPYALFPHGTLSEEAVRLRSGLKKRLMLALFVRRMLEGASRIVFTTQYEVEKVQSHLQLKLKTAIVPNIVDDTEFDVMPFRGALRRQLRIPDETVVLLHLGRVTPVKRISTSVRALARLRQAGKPVVLLVVGGDESGHRADIAELAKSLYVGDQVYFTGMLGREESKQALADADIFLLPSLSENFGMAVVEAMLARLPVVISDHVGLAQEISEMSAGVVVPLEAGDEGFSNAISELIDDSPRRKALAESGRVFAKATYSETAVASRIALLLNNIRNGSVE